MTLTHLQDWALDPALSILPNRMDTRMARVMLIAIALQESRAKHRRQLGGPARGYWQFERGGGVIGVLRHHATRAHARTLCDMLNVTPDAGSVYEAIQYQDVLAAGFARLLLWSLPKKLPVHANEGWNQYMEAWRPGKPHPDTWPTMWRQADEVVA